MSNNAVKWGADIEQREHHELFMIQTSPWNFLLTSTTSALAPKEVPLLALLFSSR